MATLTTLTNETLVDYLLKFIGLVPGYFCTAKEIDGEARYDLVTDRFLDLLGYSEDEIKQVSAYEIIHPDHRDVSVDAFERLSNGESLVNFTNQLRTKGGDYVSLRWQASWWDDLDCVVAYAEDYTKSFEKDSNMLRTAMDEALASLNNNSHSRSHVGHRMLSLVSSVFAKGG